MPSFPECCVENVGNLGGQLCSWDLCKRIQDRLNNYCKATGQNPCAPVPQEEYGVECYCCCSCFAYNTPIEAKPGEYMLVQDIVQDVDSILAGSYKKNQVQWTERVVDYSAGIGPSAGGEPLEFSNMFYVSYQHDEEGSAPQFIVTTVDHLFLMPNGKVKPVQYLKPGDKMVSSHGGLSTVQFAVVAGYRGGLHHLFFDGFNNKTLDDHLISANGVVCADYSVQLRYSNGSLNPALIDQPATDQAEARVGTANYHARHPSKQALDFINNPEKWPSGCTPVLSNTLVNVPATALRFVTDVQAADIQKNLTPLPDDNTVNLGPAQYLFNIYGAFYADLIFMIDWNNPLPNAYAWESSRQKFVLLTGGLLRVPQLVQDGLAFLLAHMVAASNGKSCVGPADYEGVFLNLRQVWSNNLFFSVNKKGYEQIERLFKAVDPRHSGADPEHICLQPSLKCRLETFKAAASMFEMPPCADPNTALCLDGVVLGRNCRRLKLDFSRPLNKETAETTDNYTITSAGDEEVTVDKAVLVGANQCRVRLTVTGVKHGTTYTLVVKNVLSKDDIPINSKCNEAEFGIL